MSGGEYSPSLILSFKEFGRLLSGNSKKLEKAFDAKALILGAAYGSRGLL